MSSVSRGADTAQPVSLVDLIAWIGRHWWRLAISMLLCAAVTFVIVRQQPFVYTATVTLVEAGEDAGSGARAGALGPLLSASGISTAGGGDRTQRALALLVSRSFVDRFIIERGLTQKLLVDQAVHTPATAAERERAYERFLSLMTIKESQNPGDPIRIQITWTDPQEAAEWANDLVRRLNNEMRLRAAGKAQQKKSFLELELARNREAELRIAISGMIASELRTLMMTRQPQGFVFEILDPAVAATKPSGPRFVVLTAAGAVVGLLVGIAWGLVASAWRRP
jgi:uncharacterized protein involved in exopolysaccharide biosynthesis